MEYKDLSNILKEFDEWKISINNILKVCQIYINIVEKPTSKYEAIVRTKNDTAESAIKTMVHCDNYKFQSNLQSRLIAHKTIRQKHKRIERKRNKRFTNFRNCNFCAFSVESNYSPTSVQTLLSAHIAKEHPLEKVYKCKMCNYTSVNLRN